MGDTESRADEARDIIHEAAEAGVPVGHYMLGFGSIPSRCVTCGGSGVIDVDETVPEVGKVATARPCPECTEAVCPECTAGKHGNCDGTAWSDALDCVVDCTCRVCA